MLSAILRYLLLVILFCVSLAAGLVTFLPMQFVANEIETAVPGLKVSNATGHVLNGSFSGLAFQQINNANLTWEINPKHLLQGEFLAVVNVSEAQMSASGNVSVPLMELLSPNEVRLDGLQASFNLAQITPFAPYPLPPITGTVNVFVEQLSLDIQALANIHSNIPIIHLSSPIMFNIEKLQVLDQLEVGEFTGLVSSSANPLGYEIELKSASGPLSVSGLSVLSNDRIKSEYEVKPSAQTPAQIIQLLNLMGQKQANDTYIFNTEYAL